MDDRSRAVVWETHKEGRQERARARHLNPTFKMTNECAKPTLECGQDPAMVGNVNVKQSAETMSTRWVERFHG